jgi:hypothetical protein
MEKLLFAASIGALLPALLLLSQYSTRLKSEVQSDKCHYFLDEVLFLQPDQIYPHMECLGTSGRKVYLDYYNFDLVLFPLIYTTFLLGLLTRLWPGTTWFWTIGLLAAVFDLLENSSMYFLLTNFPTRYERIESWVAIFTPLKFFMLAISIVGVVYGIFKWLFAQRQVLQPESEPHPALELKGADLHKQKAKDLHKQKAKVN